MLASAVKVTRGQMPDLIKVLIAAGFSDPGPAHRQNQSQANISVFVEMFTNFSFRHSESRRLRSSGHAHPEITVTEPRGSSDLASLAPLVEQEGEAYLEKAGGVRRHTVANAHSDARLLTVAGRMRAGTETDGRLGGRRRGAGFLLVGPRPFSSQPDMVEPPRGGVICLANS